MKRAVRVLMIGCGRMGGALLTRWRQQSGFSFTVVTPTGGRPLPSGVASARSAAELESRQFDVIVIATKPQQIAEAVPAYRERLAPGGMYLSIAAGFSVRSLRAVVGGEAIVRVMPNLPVVVGEGVSALYAEQPLADCHRATVDRLMKTTGHLTWVDSEDELDRVTAIAGSGPGYAFEIARCWASAGEALGFSQDEARELVLRTLAGSVQLALTSDASLDDLREGVTSKNGTTQAGLEALNGDAQLGGLLHDTLNAAYERAVALR